MDQKSEPVRVEIVNPLPQQNPWRTREDYLEEQRQQRWLFRLTIAALLVSIIASAASGISAYVAWSELKKVTISFTDIPESSGCLRIRCMAEGANGLRPEING